MKIQKVQSNQPSFGTKVQITKKIAEKFISLGKGEEMVQQIRILEYNGSNDTFVLSNSLTDNHIKASVSKYLGNNKLFCSDTINDVISFENKESCFDLIKLYSKAKQQAGTIINLKDGMEQFLPYIV